MVLLTTGSRSGHFSHRESGTPNFSACDSLSELFNFVLKEASMNKLTTSDIGTRSLERRRSTNSSGSSSSSLSSSLAPSETVFHLLLGGGPEPGIKSLFCEQACELYCHCVWPCFHEYPWASGFRPA